MISYLKRLADEARSELDGRSVAICAVAALALIAVRYGSRGEWAGPYGHLGRWMTVMIAAYLVVPIAFVKFVLGERLRDHGLEAAGSSKDWAAGFAMLAIMTPVVVSVAGSESFRAMYPIYKGPGLAGWEALYLLHLFAVEFFFRGFLIHGLKRRFGWNAILFSLLPYVMIHFGKPLPETLGSIAAGLALGALSLRSGSIMPGLAAHAGAALLMDLCAAWATRSL